VKSAETPEPSSEPPTGVAATPSEDPRRQMASVRESVSRRRIEQWSLVLQALGIPFRVVRSVRGWHLLVRLEDEARARAALDQTDAEDAEPDRHGAVPPPDRGWPFAPAVVSILLGSFFLFTGPRISGSKWFVLGSADAARLLAGEGERALTALTLHADGMHVLGNIVATLIFAGAISRWLGGGLAVLLALVAGALGNTATAAYHVYWNEQAHRSVGASTATFAALGILGGLQFLHRSRHGGWGVRSGFKRAWPVLGACLGVFAMLGVGGERVDVAAHLFGLLFGVLAGLLADRLPRLTTAGNVVLSLVSCGLVLSAWAVALARG